MTTSTRYKIGKRQRDDRVSVTLGEDLIAYLRERAAANRSDLSTELRGIIVREQRAHYSDNGTPNKRTP